MQVTSLYDQYNFSLTKCLVIPLIIIEQGSVSKIEEKLPPVMKSLKGIYITAFNGTDAKMFGHLNLNFNENAIKIFSAPVFNTLNNYPFHTKPMPVEADLKPNTTVQGYYLDLGTTTAYPIQIKIYLHYSL